MRTALISLMNSIRAQITIIQRQLISSYQTDAGQFKAKFRVSAMDYIMGNTGDATRNGIFTIYYDEAKKISDETPAPDPIEDPAFVPADMTAFTDLVAKAEQYKEDDYTSSTYTTMRNALASAKTVLANSSATQRRLTVQPRNFRQLSTLWRRKRGSLSLSTIFLTANISSMLR